MVWVIRTMKQKVNTLKKLELTGVVTAFYSQYCQENSVLDIQEDNKRKEVIEYFKNAFSNDKRNPHHLMTIKDIDISSVIDIAYRNKQFDHVLVKYLTGNPGRDVINIGAGFDTRYFRLKDYKGIYFDVDLKNVIDLKRDMVEENSHYRLISTKSAFTTHFLEKELPIKKDNPIFVAEGVMCYIEYPVLCRFIESMFEIYPNATLICDVFLYEKHLVLNDIKSKVLLKHPEDGIEKFEKYNHIYMLVDKIRKLFTYENRSFTDLRDVIEIKKILCNQENVEIIYNEQKYRPNYWIGVYEKKG